MSVVVEYDVIVVGAGIEGSSTAYQLAKRGKHVLLLEQFPLPHSRGSSHGQSRITRKAYGDKDFYTDMMDEAYALTDELQTETGQQLFVQCGCLVLGADNKYARETEAALLRHNVPHLKLGAREKQDKFPQMEFPAGTEYVLDVTGGLLRADKMLQAYQSMFVKFGGVIKDGEKMLDVQPGRPVTITTSKQIYRANTVVLAMGSWAAKFLPKLGLTLPLKPVKILVCYWKEKAPGQFGSDKFPCFFYTNDQGVMYVYGLPSDEYPGLVKVCLHAGPSMDPDSRDSADASWAARDIKKWVESHLPTVENDPSIVETCIYTMTPDEDFILDHHPAWDNIVIGAGFSGHGFKLSPVVGVILADLATGLSSKYDLSPFKISRFTKHKL